MLTDDQLKTYALAEIEMQLQSFGHTLKDHPPMPRADATLIPNVQNKLIHDELNYDRENWLKNMFD